MLVVFFTIPSLAMSKKPKNNCTDYTKFSDISYMDLAKIANTPKVTIIDVNSKKSFADSKIPGAIHFASNKDQLDKKLPDDKSKLIVAYCGGKMCTAWQRAAKTACEMGYTNIRHFSEGIKGWDEQTKG